jgi:nitroreductase
MQQLDFGDIVLKNRSYRRFYENHALDDKYLKKLVSYARLTPSAANLQPLRYRLVSAEDEKEKVFNTLLWAAYLKDFDGPVKGERPGGYIVVLKDSSVKGDLYKYDAGISAQTILLGASFSDLGGCIIASFKKEELIRKLSLPKEVEPVFVIALGKPLEQVVIEDIKKDGDIKYFRDENRVHHVPKIKLDDIII